MNLRVCRVWSCWFSNLCVGNLYVNSPLHLQQECGCLKRVSFLRNGSGQPKQTILKLGLGLKGVITLILNTASRCLCPLIFTLFCLLPPSQKEGCLRYTSEGGAGSATPSFLTCSQMLWQGKGLFSLKGGPSLQSGQWLVAEKLFQLHVLVNTCGSAHMGYARVHMWVCMCAHRHAHRCLCMHVLT